MADVALEDTLDLTNAKMYLQMGTTINQGNYESVKALVGLEITVPANTTLEKTRDLVAEILLDLLHDTIADTQNYIDENHK